jgi:hypothetical protein
MANGVSQALQEAIHLSRGVTDFKKPETLVSGFFSSVIQNWIYANFIRVESVVVDSFCFIGASED